MTGPTKRALVVDTVFLHNYPFNQRAVNQKILEKFRVHTTARVKAEVERKLNTGLPAFVLVHETEGRKRGSLSAADDSLLRLQAELRSLGQDPLLVSFDTALIEASTNGAFGDEFFRELGIQQPRTTGRERQDADVSTVLGLIRFGAMAPRVPWTEREVRQAVASAWHAEAALQVARTRGFKDVGSWNVVVSEYARPRGGESETVVLEDRGTSYVVRWKTAHPDATDPADLQWYEAPAKREAGHTLAQHGFSLGAPRRLGRRALAKRGTKILHEETNGQHVLIVESRSDPVNGPDEDHATALACIGIRG